MQAVELPALERVRQALRGVLRGHELGAQAVADERVGRLLADGAELGVVQGPRVGAGGQQHLEEDVDRVGRGEDHERGQAEVGDRVADPVVGRQAPDLDRRDLHHRGAEVDELAAEGVDLVARSGDQDPAAVERAFGERVQALRHLHAGPEDQERIAPQTVGRRLARQLAERGADPVLARQARIEDQRGGCLGRAAVLQKRADTRLPPPRGQAQDDRLAAGREAETDRSGQALDGQRDAAHHRRRELDDEPGHRLEIDAGAMQPLSHLTAVGEGVRVAGKEDRHLAPAPRETNYLIDRFERCYVRVRRREMKQTGAAAVAVANHVGFFHGLDRLHRGQTWMTWSHADESDPAHATTTLIPTRDTADRLELSTDHVVR